MSKRIDLTGRVFCRWHVIEYAGRDKHGFSRWLCRCECGVERTVRADNLLKGLSESCGCLAREIWRESTKKHHTTHGQSKTRLYKVWAEMIQRCENQCATKFPMYGGRGIKVCERWHKWEAFFDDMYDGYASGLSIDRIDVNGDYCKENCRWVTPIEQAQNRRNTIFVEGECLSKYCRERGISDRTVRARLYSGWPIEKAVSVPIRKRRKRGD
jgi:hypothetical protein